MKKIKPTNVKPKTKKKVSKKNKLIRVSSPVDPKVQLFVASEIADDQMIEREVSGEVVKTMVYQFTDSKGNTVTGLSKNGVDEVIRRINKNPASGSKIRVSPEPPIINRDIVQGDEKGVEVMVYAEDIIAGNGAWGAKFEPYMKVGRRGSYRNDFALEKALAKAQRNAARKLIPENLAIKIIQKIINSIPDAVQVIEAPKDVVRTLKPEQTNEDITYKAAIERVEAIKSDKTKLTMALGFIPKMPGLNEARKKELEGKIQGYLNKIINQ